ALPAADAPPARKGVLREPRLLADSPRARYPARARRLGLEGTVMLLLHVAADGTVDRVAVETSSGDEILDRAAAEAAALWRFDPARKDGAAIACEIRQPVEFTLADA
ncbi:MAG: energy transducer TonB, partial [Planctomycetes bacterium]|nr:energy transducer TonB [Planctomycetota bacterium]